jgi:hypothetical protein
VKTGVQGIYKSLKILDSGFRRNDGKPQFQTFREAIKIVLYSKDGSSLCKASGSDQGNYTLMQGNEDWEGAKMTGKTFFKTVTNGEIDIIQILLSLLEETGSDYCVIGGLAVNAYAEPVVSLDLDLVVVSDRIEAFYKSARSKGMKVQEFEYGFNLSVTGSDLRIQLQTDPRYQDFILRSKRREVLGYEMAVACLQDVLRGKIWAFSDETRRKSKRQKDLSDIMRLVETHPELKNELPPAIAARFD